MQPAGILVDERHEFAIGPQPVELVGGDRVGEMVLAALHAGDPDRGVGDLPLLRAHHAPMMESYARRVASAMSVTASPPASP